MRSSLLLLCLHCSDLELGAGLKVARDCTTTASDVQSLVSYFESVDVRLVMTSPDEDLLTGQMEVVSRGAFDALECAMDPANTPELHALGAELAAYVAASNPKNRALVGMIPGVLQQLVKLVNYSVHFSHMDDIIVKEAENAAEAIAIVSKANAHNNEILAHTTAASDLAAMLDRHDGEMTPKGKMWAAAALGNLMSENDSPNVTSFAHEVQQAMVEWPIMRTLVYLTRNGTVEADDPAEEMPATASRTNASRTYPHTYGWAMMHAIEKLALHPDGRAQLKNETGAQELFCALEMSPDALEQMKAEAIVAIASWGCDGANNFLAHKPKAGNVKP